MYWIQEKELACTEYRRRSWQVQGTGVVTLMCRVRQWELAKTGYRSRNWHRRRRRERTVVSRIQVGPQNGTGMTSAQDWSRQGVQEFRECSGGESIGASTLFT